MIETQAVYANGVLRPLAPLPLKENQTVELTIRDPERIKDPEAWLDDMIDTELIAECQKDLEDAPSLEEVRALLSGIRGSLSDAVLADRNESRY